LNFEGAKIRETDTYCRTERADVVEAENIEPKFVPQKKKWSTDDFLLKRLRKTSLQIPAPGTLSKIA